MPHRRLSCSARVPAPFSASLASDEAVLRFPYDERLRQLLRAIPGRRWDPVERAWCIPLGPDQAEALARLFAGLPGRPEVSEALARAIGRRRARRRRGECLRRPRAPRRGLVAELRHRRRARSRSRRCSSTPTRATCRRSAARWCRSTSAPRGSCRRSTQRERPRCASATPRAARWPSCARAADAPGDGRSGRRRRAGGEAAPRLRRRVPPRPPRRALDPDRGAERAAGARARRPGRAARARGPSGDARARGGRARRRALGELLEHLEDASVDPRVAAWLARARTWRGNIEVRAAPSEAPVFLLLGDARAPAAGAAGAAPRARPAARRSPLTLESWRLMRRTLDGWISPAARRCVAALEDGRPAPPAVLERSSVHEDADVRARRPATTRPLARASSPRSTGRPGAAPRARGARARACARFRRSAPTRSACPSSTRFLADGEVWVEPEALALLQEIREQHARAAGLVALSAATDAPLQSPASAASSSRSSAPA